ncbi:MAG: DUF3822 family protein [Flammeovirgaceae bacterium]
MQTSIANYKLIKKVKDDRFDEENLHQYALLIQLGARDFQVAVVADSDQRLLFLEDYVLNELQSHDELLALLKNLFEAHEVLQAGFWKQVKVSVKNLKFVQVPTALFDTSMAPEYLKFNASIDAANEQVLICNSPSLGITTAFAVQKSILQWLTSVYQNTQLTIVHQSSALIEGFCAADQKNEEHPILLYIDRFKMHICYVENGNLKYYNQFVIHQFSDYVKYIMLVMKTMNLNQQTSKVHLWGYIGKNSPHYHEFIKYVRNVVFGQRPEHLAFGYLFDDVQEHQYFDLYAINLL